MFYKRRAAVIIRHIVPVEPPDVIALYAAKCTSVGVLNAKSLTVPIHFCLNFLS